MARAEDGSLISEPIRPWEPQIVDQRVSRTPGEQIGWQDWVEAVTPGLRPTLLSVEGTPEGFRAIIDDYLAGVIDDSWGQDGELERLAKERTTVTTEELDAIDDELSGSDGVDPAEYSAGWSLAQNMRGRDRDYRRRMAQGANSLPSGLRDITGWSEEMIRAEFGSASLDAVRLKLAGRNIVAVRDGSRPIIQDKDLEAHDSLSSDGDEKMEFVPDEASVGGVWGSAVSPEDEGWIDGDDSDGDSIVGENGIRVFYDASGYDLDDERSIDSGLLEDTFLADLD